MRILFYLPVITAWWFEHIVLPLIRAASRGAEVHVLVPPYWQSTGIGPTQLRLCLDLPSVVWHLMRDENHPRYRFLSAPAADIVATVAQIRPDLTLCRSADIATPAQFPGVVRFVMEGGAPPFVTDPRAVYFARTLFDHALLPDLSEPRRRWLMDALAPQWLRIREAAPHLEREDFLRNLNIETGQTIIGLPLEYEHEEVHFWRQNTYGGNLDLIETVASAIGDDTVVMATRHPLNAQYPPDAPLMDTIAKFGGKVRLLEGSWPNGGVTTLLSRYCDGMVVGNSKSFGNCAFWATPMLRLSRFQTGAWMNAYETLDDFLGALRSGTPLAADEGMAQLWFAFHLANMAFLPNDPALDADALYDRAVNAVDPARWQNGLAAFRQIEDGPLVAPPNEEPTPCTILP